MATPEYHPGYWADHPYADASLNHPYKRHSVGEIDEFVGWDKLNQICEAGNSLRNRALPAALFLTGTRISEAIQLRRANFNLDDGTWVQCSNVPMVKQKVAKPFRTFSFLKAEPLWPHLKEYVEAPMFALKPSLLLFPIGRNMAWKIITEQGKKASVTVWNHWFRSQRASQMGAEYNMTENDMMEWFKVKDRNWARRYAKKGDWGLRKAILENKPPEWHK